MSYPQKYQIPAHQLIRNFLKNREDFYKVLLPRVPIPAHRQAIESAVGSAANPPSLQTSLDSIATDPPSDPFLANLGLRDLLKKPASGLSLGRTVISLEEALQVAEQVEETGFILFNHLAQISPQSAAIFAEEAKKRQTALASLLRLRDDLRYHRFPSTLP